MIRQCLPIILHHALTKIPLYTCLSARNFAFTNQHASSHSHCGLISGNLLLYSEVGHKLHSNYWRELNLSFPNTRRLSTVNRRKFKSFEKKRFETRHEEESEESGMENEDTNHFTHVFTPFQNAFLNLLVSEFNDAGDMSVSEQSWSGIEETISAMDNQRIVKFWPSMMINCLSQLQQPIRAQSLFDFILGTNHVHVAFLTQYIHLLYRSTQNESEILRAYELIDTSVLNADSIEKLVCGLSVTKRWKEGVELLKDASITTSHTSAKYSPMIIAAVINQDWEFAFQYLKLCGENRLLPSPAVFDALVDERYPKTEDTVWTTLEIMSQYQWYFKTEQALRLKSWLENAGWDVALTSANTGGTCKTCQHQLKRDSLTGKQFNQLQHQFLSKSLIRGDVFLSTTPEELEKYNSFLKEAEKFDIVIDALNIAHFGRRWNWNYVYSLVENFEKRNKNILVVTRQHTARFTDMRNCENLASVFYADDQSKDDPFTLYAALYSGPRCLLVTRDEMRDHCFLLGDEYAKVFRTWQRSHQIIFSGFRKNKLPILLYPASYLVETQSGENGGCWHIPYDNSADRASYQRPHTWLCAYRKKMV